MNEELKQKLLTYLQYLENTVGKTNDFVAEQTPLLVQEYVRYSAVYHGTLVVIGIGILLIALVCAGVMIREFKRYGEDSRPGVIAPCAISGIVSLFIGCILIGHNIDCAIKSLVAPRVLILEYVRDMLK